MSENIKIDAKSPIILPPGYNNNDAASGKLSLTGSPFSAAGNVLGVLGGIFDVAGLIYGVVERNHQEAVQDDTTNRRMLSTLNPLAEGAEYTNGLQQLDNMAAFLAKTIGATPKEAKGVMNDVVNQRIGIKDLRETSGELLKDQKIGGVSSSLIAMQLSRAKEQYQIPDGELAEFYKKAKALGRDAGYSTQTMASWLPGFLEIVGKNKNTTDPEILSRIENGLKYLEKENEGYRASMAAPEGVKKPTNAGEARVRMRPFDNNTRLMDQSALDPKTPPFASFLKQSQPALLSQQDSLRNLLSLLGTKNAMANDRTVKQNVKPPVQSEKPVKQDKSIVDGKLNTSLASASVAVSKCIVAFQTAAKQLQKPIQVKCTVDVQHGT